MSLNFKKITLEDREIFDKYYEKQPQISSYISFVTLFAWRNKVNYDFAYKNGEIFLKFFNKSKNKSYFFLPQNTEESLKRAIEILKEENEPLAFYNITENQLKIIDKLYPGNFEFERNRDGDNYIYLSESLAKLSGSKLHSKKNKLNKFKKTYDYEYIRVTNKTAEECIEVAKSWCERKCNDIKNDYADISACEEVLYNLDSLNIVCGAIRCDGKIIAFSIGERYNDEVAIIHFEKADTSYDGSYAAINNEFIINEWANVKYINREEDMGLEGLRRAKTSYCPEFMLETYIAEFKNV